MSGMDTTAIEQFQMHGQDIPWLLEHWAEHKPDHPALVWEPREGDGRQLDLRRAARPTCAGSPPGCAARGIAKGDKVLIHAENCPEMVLSWLACATLGAVGGDHQHQVGGRRGHLLRRARRRASPRSRSRSTRRRRRRAAPALKWIAVTDDNSGEPADATQLGARLRRLRLAVRRRRRLDAAGTVEPMLPFGIMFTSGTTNRPKAVVHTHANAIWASRIGPAQHRPDHRRHVPDLPAVLPRERAELVAVLRRSASARTVGAHAEVVAEPLLGRWSSTASRTSR